MTSEHPEDRSFETDYQLCDAICALTVAADALRSAHRCRDTMNPLRQCLQLARLDLAAELLAMGSERPPFVRRALDRVARATRGAVALH